MRLKAPKPMKSVAYGPEGVFDPGKEYRFQLDPDGTLNVPRLVAIELLEKGFELVDDDAPADLRTEIENASNDELSVFLAARAKADHYFEKFKDYHSDQLREEAKKLNIKTRDGDCLLTIAADKLDQFHCVLNEKAMGRPVVMTEDEKRKLALDLHTQEQKYK